MNLLCSLKNQKSHRSTYLLSPTIPDPDYDSGKDSDSRESDGKDSSTAWDSDGNKNLSSPLRRGSSHNNADRRLWASEGRPVSEERRYDMERRRDRYDSDRRSSEEKELEEEGEERERRRVKKEGKKREEKGRKEGEEKEVKRRPVKGQERRESSSSGASR
jgi:hypothetical protein